MTITEIKSTLTIQTVLTHYGLRPDANKMLRCPFHADQKASMKVYPDTNTVYCFAGGCEVKHLDVIDFIFQMDKTTKHEAILKAKTLCNGTPIEAPKPKKIAAVTSLTDTFAQYQKSLKNHAAAKAYCASRCLDWQQLKIGYKGKNTTDKWGRGCLIFPLQNIDNEVVSLYGRGIEGSSHYYQTGRSGLYPGYPKTAAKRIILTESIIDAASLLQQKEVIIDHEILALFGTNGLTAEHLQALKKLPHLEETTFFLDGDEAGQKAVEQYAILLKKELPKVRLMNVLAMDDEDVNSILQAHDPMILVDMVAKRKPITSIKMAQLDFQIDFQSKEKNAPSDSHLDFQSKEKNEPILPPKNQENGAKKTLNTTNPYNIIYQTSLATYFLKGGIRHSSKDFDHLKVTLVVENLEGRKSRQKLDLYEDKQVEKSSRVAGDKLGLRPDLIELDLQVLTDELEGYRRELFEAKKKEETVKIQVPAQLRSSCLDFLKGEHLLAKINENIGKSGITGEENSRLLLFVVASSFKMPHTLHALIQGASGSGKTRLLKIIADLMPAESVKKYTRVTDGSFYNQDEYFFKNKLLCFEDIDGLKEDALLAVRELQSNEILITSTSIKDENGGIRGGERIVRGPIASMSCTTKAAVYEDNISRCFVVAVDESSEQNQRVIQYQNDKAAGIIDGKLEETTRVFLQNCVRLLQPLEVINPFANQIKLPPEAHKIRRLNELYQSFVRQITLLHQFQRKRDKQGRLVSEKTDLKQACDILFDSIILKVDELDGSLRQFFEKLKKHVEKKSKGYEFTRFEVRKITGVSKTQQHRFLSQLVSMEYIQQWGFANRGYRYKIVHWDDIQAVRQRIKTNLDHQLALL